MVDWADDLKKKLGQNPPSPKKEEEGASVSSSIKQAGETVQESEKQLEKLAEKKARLLESISKKVETLKVLVSQAGEATENGLFGDALALWKQVLELDPQNADALVGLDLCQSRLAELETPVVENIPAVSENPVRDLIQEIPVETPVEMQAEKLPEAMPILEKPAENPVEKVSESGPMAQNELDALISQITETPPEEASPVPEEVKTVSEQSSAPVPEIDPPQDATPLSSSELNQVLASIQGEPEPVSQPEEVPAVLPVAESQASSPEVLPDPIPVASVPEPSASPVQPPVPDEDEGAKELEAVLKEVNQTQLQSVMEKPPQIEQTDVMGGATPSPMMAVTKEDTAKLDQIKAAIPAQASATQAPVAGDPPVAKRKTWILVLCVVALVLLTGALVSVILSMFDSPAPQTQKAKTSPPPSQTFTVENALNQGEKQIESGNIQEAMNAFLQIKEMYPTPSKMVDDWMRAGQAVYARFQKEESAEKKKEWLSAVTKIYEQVIEQFPRDEKIAVAYYRTAECFASQGAYSSAFSYYDALIKYYPDFQNLEEAVYARARMLLEQEKFPECREAYLKIIKDFPQSKMAKWAELDIAKSYKMEVLKGQSPV